MCRLSGNRSSVLWESYLIFLSICISTLESASGLALLVALVERAFSSKNLLTVSMLSLSSLFDRLEHFRGVL